MSRFVLAAGFLLIATILETNGDATIRIGLFDKIGIARIAYMAGGAALLFGYGVFLNLSPLPFERVVGLYIATLFMVWQVTAFFIFRTIPSLPIFIGGGLIVCGGLVVTFWTNAGAAD